MTLDDLVQTSVAVAATSSRLEKIALLVQELTRYAFTEGAASVLQPITELIMRAIGHLDDEINKKQIRIRTEFADVPRIPLDPEAMNALPPEQRQRCVRLWKEVQRLLNEKVSTMDF